MAQHEPEAYRQEDREEPERARGDRREVAEEPVDHTTEPVHVEERDDHGDRRGEEDPDDDAREEQGLDLDHPPARRGDQIDGGRRQERAGEGKPGEPHRLEHRESEPEALADDDAERGAARDAEHRGLGERVPRERLEGDAGDREGGARERRHRDPGETDRTGHDALDRRRRGAPRHRVDHRAGRDGGAPDEERRGGDGDEERGEPSHHEREPCLRAHLNASG